APSASFSNAITNTYLVWPPAVAPPVPPAPEGGGADPPAPMGGGAAPLPPVPAEVQEPASVNVSAMAPVEVMRPAPSSSWNSRVAVSPQAAVSPIVARATDQLAVPPLEEKVALPAASQFHPGPT